MTAKDAINELKKSANTENVSGMAKYGINPENTLGVKLPEIKRLARLIGINHNAALELWESGIHEAKMMASMVANPYEMTDSQMDAWVMDFDSWDVCDCVCNKLFHKSPNAYIKAEEWANREEAFVRRAGFTLMTQLAVHDKRAPDEPFEHFLTLVYAGSDDDRNFVKKAVNWALRQIGKRNLRLNMISIETGEKILNDKRDSRAARWVALEALRELRSSAVHARLIKKQKRNK